MFACHDSNGNYLFAKRGVNCRDEHGRWDPGSGAVEFGESPEDTLKKEIQEEYMTYPLETEYLGFRNVLRMDGDRQTHWIAHDYRVFVNRDAVDNGEPHKLDEIGWFKLNFPPSPMHSQWQTFYEKYRSRLF